MHDTGGTGVPAEWLRLGNGPWEAAQFHCLDGSLQVRAPSAAYVIRWGDVVRHRAQAADQSGSTWDLHLELRNGAQVDARVAGPVWSAWSAAGAPPAVPVTAVPGPGAQPSGLAGQSAAGTEPGRRGRGRRAVLIGAGAVLVIAALIGGTLAYRQLTSTSAAPVVETKLRWEASSSGPVAPFAPVASVADSVAIPEGALIVGSVTTDPLKLPEPSLWILRADGASAPVNASFGPPGTTEVVSLARSVDRLYAGGVELVDGVGRPALWQTDTLNPNAAWSKVNLGDLATKPGYVIGLGADPGNDQVVAVAQVNDGALRSFGLARTGDGSWRVEQLPQSDDAYGLGSVAVSNNVSVATGQVERDGRSVPAIWTEEDGTWTRRALEEVPGNASLQAVGALDGGFVVIGSVSDQPGQTSRSKVIAWTSKTGQNWAVADVAVPGSENDLVPLENIEFGTSAAEFDSEPDFVMFGASQSGFPLFVTFDGSSWAAGTGSDASLPPLGPPVVAAGEAGRFAALGQPGTFAVATFDEQIALKLLPSLPGLPEARPVDQGGLVAPLASGLAVFGSAGPVRGPGEGWGPESRAWRSDGTGWVPLPAPPTRGTVVSSAKADGPGLRVAGLAAGDSEANFNDAFVAYVDPSGAWSQVATFGGPGSQSVSAIQKVGPSWWAAGSSRDDVSEKEQGRVWSSADGTTWQEVPGPFASDGASVLGLCALGDTILALGSTTNSSGATVPAIWRQVRGTWESVKGVPFEDSGSVSACGAADSRVVFLGSSGVESAVWEAGDDLSEFSLTMPFGILDRPTGIYADSDGKAVIIGSEGSTLASTPAVWTSGSSGKWERLDVPSPSPGQAMPVTASSLDSQGRITVVAGSLTPFVYRLSGRP